MAVRPPIAVDLPFRFGADGGVVTGDDLDRQIRQRLITIVGTEPSERVMLPQFGVPVASFLYEPHTPAIAVELRNLTEAQAAMWEPALKVQSVIPVRDDEGHTTEIEMRYRRLNAEGNEGGPMVHQARISEGQIKEWVRG
ncbi:GPW/gp25 family protein [Streptosporangium sp. NPDC023825]|uniref:GPW/gp25 family protein n=1 Tax=Streptosporangium sp. NPDC023825 TaxID=3154909 RepID=UPI0034490F3A